MKCMVKEKKDKCWRRFCEESGEKDLWEVIMWAKDPLRLKEKMKRLYNKEGKELVLDEEKVEGLVGDIFGQEDREEVYHDNEGGRGGTSGNERMEDLIRTALRGTSNKSAAGPDRIGYRLIKAVIPTKLGDELIRDIADVLREGRIPAESKKMDVVMIP